MKKNGIALLWVTLLFGCHSLSSKNGIPSNAQCITETFYHQLYLMHSIEDSLKVFLFSYNKESSIARLILTTNPQACGDGLAHEESYPIPVSNIKTVQKATILSWKDEPLTILIEYCTDHRNVESIIFKEGNDEAIHLPTNRGMLGVSEEEGLLIMQSYGYYAGGGRYNTIDAFDKEGNRLSSMSPKLNPELDETIPDK